MTTLSQAYRGNPLNLHHIIPLDFDSVQGVPDSHAWPQINDFQSQSPSNERSISIPVINLLDPNVAQLIGHACETWGVFQVTNHGIPLSLFEDVEAEARRLFALPARIKKKALRSPDGATGYGVARISPFFSKCMWHEGFTIMGSPVEHAKKLWPDDYKHFCDTMDHYQKKIKSLAYQLLLTIFNSLEASEQEILNWAAATFESEGALQLNSYPPCPDPNRAIGLAPHTDSLFLTILHQNGTNGLQIFRKDFGWISVSPVSGALVINIGDLLHIFSNARFPTVYHRAVVNETNHRISMAYFYGPPMDTEVGPCNKLHSPPIYRSLTVKEYVCLKNKHLEKALSHIRI